MQTDSGAVSNLAAARLARHARQCHIDGTAARRSRGKTMMMLPISLMIAAGVALLNIWLPMRVSRTSRQEEVWVGDGRKDRVTRRIRAHSNYIVYTAMASFHPVMDS